MSFVQATTGSGGWPMSVFLTPDLKPFFGGTYFPPKGAHGRLGFSTLPQRISQLWHERRPDLARTGAEVIEALRRATSAGTPEILDRSLLTKGFEALERTFDTQSPGFGLAPKFPRPVVLHFFLRHYARSG